MEKCSAADVIERHPEVKAVVLEWVTSFTTIYEDRYGNVIIAKGAAFSPVQCVCGKRKGAIQDLSNLDCWDEIVTDDLVSQNMTGGTLFYRHEEATEDDLTTYVPPNLARLEARILRGKDMGISKFEISPNSYCR